jgi:hypothetical protein
VPGITTGVLLDNLGTSVVLASSVNNDGGGKLLENGIMLSTSNNFSNSSNVIYGTADAAVVGDFSVKIAGLQKSTEYYYRAYSLNINGVSYGEIKSFTTSNVTFSPYITSFRPNVAADIADWVFDKYTGFDESGEDLIWFSSAAWATEVSCYWDGEDLKIVSPLIRVAKDTDILSFNFYTGGYGSPVTKVKVYITEDLDNLGTPVKDWSLGGGRASTAIPLASYVDKSIYVVIVVEAGDFIFTNFAIAPPV